MPQEAQVQNKNSRFWHKIKNKNWFINTKIKIFFHSDQFMIKASYFKASILAILSGVIISFLIIGGNDANPLQFFEYVFRIAFDWRFINDSLNYWAIYILGGLAVAVAFKSGMFNIGVSGQMMLAGSMTIVLSLKNPAMSQAGGLVAAILISMLVGAFLASIAGVLKAYFNIHEVVTTIMLNWIVWYLMKWMFMADANGMWNPGFSRTIEPNLSTALFGGEMTWVIPLVIALIATGLVVFIFNYTVLGFRIKAVGSSYNASLYGGTNVRFYVIISMTISGALAGLMGFAYYMTELRQIQFSSDILPSIGFDVITVALVAFLNGFAIIPVAILWAIIKVAVLPATQFPQFQMSKQMGQLIFGIMIYMMAISSLFFKFKPIHWTRKWYRVYRNPLLRQEVITVRTNIKALRQEAKAANKKYSSLRQEAQTKTEKLMVKQQHHSEALVRLGKIRTERSNKKFIMEKMYRQSQKYGITGIKWHFQQAIFGSLASALDQFVELKNSLLKQQTEILAVKKTYLGNKNQAKITKISKINQLPWKNYHHNMMKKYNMMLAKHNDFMENYEGQKTIIIEKYLTLLQQNYQKNASEYKAQIRIEKNLVHAQNKDLFKLYLSWLTEKIRFWGQKLLTKGLIYLFMGYDHLINYGNYHLVKNIITIKKAHHQAIIVLRQNKRSQIKIIKDDYDKVKNNTIETFNNQVTMIINDVKIDNKILRTELNRKIKLWRDNNRNNNMIYISEGSEKE